MKKFYNLMAIVGLSLLTIGATAGPIGTSLKKIAKPIKANDRFSNPEHHSVKKATGTSQDCLIDYLAGDQLISPSATFYYWQPVLALNSRYGVKDTGTTYNLLSNNAIVTFDTLFDLYSDFFVTPITPGSVTLDTLTVAIQYHNTSGDNDTIIFSVMSVDANGFLSTAMYGADTAVIPPGFFAASGNTLDSMHYIQIVKSISIPASARKGYNFAVNATVHTSAADYLKDTLAIVYYSQGSNDCSALGGDYTPAATSMGVSDKAQRNVNSWVQGLYYQNDLSENGTNGSMYWPLTSGSEQGFCANGNGYYSSPLPLALVLSGSCAGDTNWFSVQDLAIYPSVHIGPVGINEVTSNGLSVGQNYPNPFNKETQIAYSLTKSSDVVFSVYDMTGRKIVDNTYTQAAPGQHMITLSANMFTPGVYFYTFNVNGNAVTKKMVITE